MSCPQIERVARYIAREVTCSFPLCTVETAFQSHFKAFG